MKGWSVFEYSYILLSVPVQWWGGERGERRRVTTQYSSINLLCTCLLEYEYSTRVQVKVLDTAAVCTAVSYLVGTTSIPTRLVGRRNSSATVGTTRTTSYTGTVGTTAVLVSQVFSTGFFIAKSEK